MKNLFLAISLGCFCFQSCSQSTKEQTTQKEISFTDTIPPAEELIELTKELPHNYNTLNKTMQLKINTKKNSITPYSTTKSQAKQLRDKIKTQNISKDSAGVLFTEFLVNKMIPYWYGTTWDFNGHTDIPGEGLVACGYFVSTTLKHMGLNINRYKLAQKAAMDGSKIIQPNKSPVIWRGESSKFAEYFSQNYKDGLYKIGLSNHVGYIYKKSGEVFFLHSSYIDPPFAVTIELANESVALLQSTVFVITDITYNEFLISAWLSGEEIKTQ
ncbi:MAG: hypothetical protein ACK4K0_00580 [Flavobacteriales bacterium]